MRRSVIVLSFCFCLASTFSSGQIKDKDLKAYLDGVTERGRALYAYDQAAWHGTDAFFTLHPDTAGLTHYICRKTASGWVVSFGKWNEAHDKFFVVYEADETGKPGNYVAKKYDPPLDATNDLAALERALELAVHDFEAQKRPYNSAILPAPGGNLYIYIYPGQTKDNVWPLGGDVRYTISADGKQIIEKRQLHKVILDMEFKPDVHPVAGYHNHVLSDVPEDTDVLYVLNRRPLIPEYIGAGKRHYVVNTDGTIEVQKK
ncbi:MAG: hypothetical protein ABR990_08795 [Terracidiphilus sp.]|jgi:hypothetical protein